MITLLYGNERYLLNNEIKKRTHDIEYAEVNMKCTSEFSDEVYQFAYQVPFMAEKRIIILNTDVLKADDELLAYINEPSETTDLVIMADEVDLRTKVFKVLKKEHEVLECNKLSAKNLQLFILKKLEENGCLIRQSVYEFLVKRLNYWSNEDCSLYTIEIYLNQMMLASNEITEEVIMNFIPKTLDENVFGLCNHLLELDGSKLFELAMMLLDDKESPIMMLSALLRTFRLAFKASLYPEKKGKELAEILGVPSMQYAKATVYSPDALHTCCITLQAGVNRIKNGQSSQEVFILSLAKCISILENDIPKKAMRN